MNKQINCLLISNDVSLTGAPILLLELAKYLCKKYKVSFWSIFDIPKHCKSLQNDFESIGSVKYFHNYKPNNEDIQFAKENYDFIICNTIETANIAYELNAILWYHEMFINNPLLLNNIRIVSLSNKHTKFLKSNGVHNIITSIHGRINSNLKSKQTGSTKVNVLLIGSFINRKNQLGALDIVRPFKNIHLTMVGSFCSLATGDDNYYRLVKENIGDIDCELIDVQPHEKVIELIDTCDILLCPSLQDTYPVCVIEALERGKTVLLTEHTCLDLDELLEKPYNSRCCSIAQMSNELNRLLQSKLYKRPERIKDYDYEKRWDKLITLIK